MRIVSSLFPNSFFADTQLPEWPPSGIIPVPEHYQLIAGYVQITSETKEIKNDCGEVIRNEQTNYRDWISYAYDIRAQNGAIIWINRKLSADQWADKDSTRTYGYMTVVYYNLGRIQPFWTYDDVVATGQAMIAGGQSQYNWLGGALAPLGGAAFKGDNCDTFARSLYAKMLLPAPAGIPTTSRRHILKRLVTLKRWASEQLSVYLY